MGSGRIEDRSIERNFETTIEENIDIDKFEEILAEEEADKEKLEELKNKL